MRFTSIGHVVLAFLLSIVGSGLASDEPAIELERIVRDCGTQSFEIRSEVLEEERELLVRLPRAYGAADARYPVLVLLDAEWHFNIAAADLELLSECSYIDPHPVPEMIVVGVVNQDRNRDFTPTHCAEHKGMRFPTSGEAIRFRRFLVDELLPAIDASFRTQPYRILAGWSLGGLFGMDTLLGEDDAFKAYLAISPSLWWDDELALQKLAAAHGPREGESRKLVVTLGTAEEGSMVWRSTEAFMADLERRALPGLEFELLRVQELGHNYSPKMAFFLGLATLFGDWRAPAEVLEQGLDAVDGYYAALSAHYGFPVPTPESTFSSLGWSLFEAEEIEASGRVFREWASRHPDSALAQASLGSYLRECGRKDEARALFLRAIELEGNSPNPRASFIHDLRRDVAAIQEGN